MDASVLVTKLHIPPASPKLVARPRLLARLADGLTHPLTLVSAPAGFGKTTLIGEWRTQNDVHNFPLAWLSLDDDDNEPIRQIPLFRVQFAHICIEIIKANVARIPKEVAMDRQRRSSIAIALILILVGAWLMSVQFVPGLQSFALIERSWPLIVVAVGAGLGVIALVTWTPGMFVPASIVAGIGGLLYYQNMTNDWASWAYAWTLILGFVGVGIFFANLLEGKIRAAIVAGGWMVILSGIMYLIFSSFLGGPNVLGPYWPLLIILLGVATLVQAFFRR